ncbi:unnamed protein product [Orchesella dallaii]|uniref:Death domain-containing protein n=1 Tax=Orchesella dallaii TaxID=48710 RepID=A0ABP1R6B1_9HEXA
MADTQIGTESCTFISIYQTLNESNQLSLHKWMDIAPRLGVPDERINALKNKIMFLNLNTQAIFLELFRLWSEQEEIDKSIGKLIEVMEAVKLKGAADNLRKRFGIPID